ncbi:MAG: DMT family transporter [Candidatus Velamenicoccus archaeovorus]
MSARNDARRSAGSEAVGGIVVAAGAVLFGVVVVFGKVALRHGLPVPSALAVRFGVGAAILAVALVLLRRPVVAVEGERRGMALLALFGYAVEAGFFFAALQHGTAAAVTLLFFTYPVFVTLLSWATGRGRPTRLTVFSLVLAVGGAAIVVTTGAGLTIEPVGVVFALASAVTYSGYLFGAGVVVKRTNPLTSAMWLSLGASVGLAVFALVTSQARWPSGGQEWWPVLGMGAGTAGAFVCLMGGLQRLGAVRTSIVSALEPLSSAILAWIFLHEDITVGVVIGGLLILAGAVSASVSRQLAPEEPPIP